MNQKEREAYDAMRESIYAWCAVIERCSDTYKLATDAEAPEVMSQMRAALRLANVAIPRDEVTR